MPSKGSWLEPCYSMRLVQPFVQYLVTCPEMPPSLMTHFETLSPDERIPARHVHKLLLAAVRITGDEDLGLHAAAQLGHGSCDVLQFAAISAPTWGKALTSIFRYVRILNEAAQFSLDVRGGVACAELRASVEPNRAASDFRVASIAVAARAWLGSLNSFELWFTHPEPSNTEAYTAMFGPARVRFKAPCEAILFDAALLDTPMPYADPSLHAVLCRHADHLLSLVPESSSLVPRVRKVVIELLPTGDSDASKVAGRLGMSRRSLTRHLDREHITYSELLEQLRHELALSYLRKSDLDVQQVAFLLGYSLTAAFSRAFRRWEGKSPIEYRRSISESDKRPRALTG